MIIKYKTPGAEERHIEHSLRGNSLTLDDEITLKVNKYEQDDDRHIDICRDKMGNLTTGVIPGWSEEYVAQIDIPARTYHEVDSGKQDEEGNQIMIPEADPYDPANTTLTLWETEE